MAQLLRAVASVLSRVRRTNARVADITDRIDRSLGETCRKLRYKANRLEGKDTSDGIPF